MQFVITSYLVVANKQSRFKLSTFDIDCLLSCFEELNELVSSVKNFMCDFYYMNLNRGKVHIRCIY
jgi:hypothetical protein